MLIVDWSIRYWRQLLVGLLLIFSTSVPSVHAANEICDPDVACAPPALGDMFCVIVPPVAPPANCVGKAEQIAKDICATVDGTNVKFLCTVKGCCCTPAETTPCNSATAKNTFCETAAQDIKDAPICTGVAPVTENTGSTNGSSTTSATTPGDASGSTSLVPVLSLILASLLVLAVPSCV